MDVMSEWGFIVVLSYIVVQCIFLDYSEMVEFKVLFEFFVCSFGYYFVEKKVCVNIIFQFLIVMIVGSGIKGFQEFFDYVDKMLLLGNVLVEVCVDYCVMMFLDLICMVIMQNFYYDGGFFNMGMSLKLLEE